MEIRKWCSADFAEVRELLKVTWLATYGSFIPENDILTYLDKTYSDTALKELFDDVQVSGSAVRENNRLIAWMRTKQSPAENRFYISSVYVLPDYQGKGLGRRLLQHAASEAEKFGYNRIFLGVMKQNTASLEWYRKIGFVFFEEQPFTMGNTEVAHLIGYWEF